MMQLDRPLAFFDIESTGLNPQTDRIIDLAIVKLLPGGERMTVTFRINPGIPIPPGASRIHGIADADVAGAPPFKDVVRDVLAAFEGCDLAGFNVIRYDLPLLCAECARAGDPFETEGRRVVDPQRIFHQRERRDLAAALKFYRDEDHAGAHGALADTEATIKVLEGQYAAYADLPSDLDALHAYCNPVDRSRVDREGKLRWRDEQVVMAFGKNSGARLRDLVRDDPGYLNWILSKDFPDDTKAVIQDALKGSYPEPG